VSHTDPHLDAQLRDVPLPDGFAERLKAALLPSDESLDAAIAAVAVPSTVLARLKEIPGDWWSMRRWPTCVAAAPSIHPPADVG
jgi:hypothetical protein